MPDFSLTHNKVLHGTRCVFLFIFILIIGNGYTYAQSKSVEQLKNEINDELLSNDVRSSAFLRLLERETRNESFETYLAQYVDDTNAISPFLRMKLAFNYAFHRSDFSDLNVNSTKILSNPHCTTIDSVNIFNTWSTYYTKQGYYNNAIEHIVKVISINNRKKDYLNSEFAYSYIASILMKQKLYDEAIKNYKKSYSLGTKYTSVLYPYSMMNNMGLAYHYLNEIDSALFYFNKVLYFLENELPDAQKNNNTDFFLGLVKGNVGDVYLSMHEYIKAEPLLLNDLESSLRANEKENTCITQLNLGKIYLETARYDEAKKYLELAYDGIKQNNFRNIKKKYFLFCAEYAEKTKNYTECFNYYKQYNSLNDSINLENYHQKMANHNLDFELLRKEKELNLAVVKNEKDHILMESQKTQLYFAAGISLLLLFLALFIYRNYIIKSKLSTELIVKNNEIIARGVELQKALDEKDLMLKEIHHRVKNNLQLVSSLLRLQAMEIDDSKVKTAIEESVNRLASISLIHQKLYTKESLQAIALKSYYESLINQISNLYLDDDKKIICETNISDINLSIDNAVPVGLIVNEIITNSYKHAFTGRKEGIISSVIKKEGVTVTIILRDNGIGIKDDTNNITSFGMTLINLLVEQMDGKIECYNDNGTVFKIEFVDQEKGMA